MRCKACNDVLQENEIVYDTDRENHEELCKNCQEAILKAEFEQDLEDEKELERIINEYSKLTDS